MSFTFSLFAIPLVSFNLKSLNSAFLLYYNLLYFFDHCLPFSPLFIFLAIIVVYFPFPIVFSAIFINFFFLNHPYLEPYFLFCFPFFPCLLFFPTLFKGIQLKFNNATICATATLGQVLCIPGSDNNVG